ncbi:MULTISPECIES: hypothetical protein [unclassified Streptomyces]|uniref:hypothetical protein n=1 Tax=unclassified Streptomyces TaxID=2593676 RepID=UPI0023656153|nr:MULTISPECIES: hypothetical protein [unclassified Streptomyces]MDF3148219.1 hypothetical protein [Streptomyces sp. T21Q-yed]WDF43525.1 hypothetical protein PBV52_45495 [Streptomyces sp. T12]
MSFSYVEHHTLTPHDLAFFEALLAHTQLPDHPRGEDCPAPEDPWSLHITSTCHRHDGTWRETLCVFRRTDPEDDLHAQYVEIHFTQDGRALPGFGLEDLSTAPHITPHAARQVGDPAVLRPRQTRPRSR